MFPGVTVEVQRGNLLASINVPDAVPALLVPHTEIEGRSHVVKRIYSAAELPDDVTGRVREVVEDFYAEVGGSTALLYVECGSETSWDASAVQEDIERVMRAYSDVNLTGVLSPVSGHTTTKTGGFLCDWSMDVVLESKAKLTSLQERGTPTRLFVDGCIVDDNVDALTFAPNSATNGYAAIVLGGSEKSAGCGVGVALGRATKVGAHVKIGDGALGALSIGDVMYGAQRYDELGAHRVEALHDKGYMTFMRRQGLAGYYFGVDNMCSNDDYSILVHGRVIDKAQRIAIASYMPLVESNVQMADDGSIDAADAEYIAKLLESQLRAQMSEQVSNVKVVVPTAQGLVNRKRLRVEVSVLPLGYLTWITVELGLASNL